MQSSFLTESPDPAVTNQARCAELSQIFSLCVKRLSEAIAQTGGRPLADEFAQQINRYATQHGWSVLTGLTNLVELNQCVPDVDARMLASVYSSYTQYAVGLACQILGAQLLNSTLTAVLASLSPAAAQLNALYPIIRSQ